VVGGEVKVTGAARGPAGSNFLHRKKSSPYQS
jgi:hypothetical protein